MCITGSRRESEFRRPSIFAPGSEGRPGPEVVRQSPAERDQRGLQRPHIGDRQARRAFARAIEQAGEHTAWAELEEEVALLLVHQVLHRFRPADRAGARALKREAAFYLLARQ